MQTRLASYHFLQLSGIYNYAQSEGFSCTFYFQSMNIYNINKPLLNNLFLIL